jgi:phage tail-like protein
VTIVGDIFVQLHGRTVAQQALPPGRYTLGRAPDCSIQLLDLPGVDLYHAAVEVDAADVWLRNLSPRGTLIDGSLWTRRERHRLEDGATWQIEWYVCLWRLRGVGARAAEPPATLKAVERWPAPGFNPGAIVVDRPASGQPLVETPVSRYLDDLPGIYHDEEAFLGRYLKIFETLWEPLEQRQDHISLYFDPRTCPTRMLDWFAGWLGFALDSALPEGSRRALLAEAIWLLRWRGTRAGLARLIELCTGQTPEIFTEAGSPPVIVVRLARPHNPEVTAELVERLIEANKPAHCAYSVEWRQ